MTILNLISLCVCLQANDAPLEHSAGGGLGVRLRATSSCCRCFPQAAASKVRNAKLKDVPSAESSRTVRGLGKGVSGKPYPHEVQCEETATRTWDLSVTGGEALPLHQARPSDICMNKIPKCPISL